MRVTILSEGGSVVMTGVPLGDDAKKMADEFVERVRLSADRHLPMAFNGLIVVPSKIVAICFGRD